MKTINRQYAIGDIHGRASMLQKVLSKSKFNREKDRLIVLGDIVDRGKNTKKVVEELMQIKNLKFVMGNHDYYFINYIKSGQKKEWLWQNCKPTLKSYGDDIPKEHMEFFKNEPVLYYENNNRLFVHAGMEIGTALQEQNYESLVNDSSLVNYVIEYVQKQNKRWKKWTRNLSLRGIRVKVDKQKAIPGWEFVFVGHVPTLKYKCNTPIKISNLIMMDTGAGYDNGRLSMVDIDTFDYISVSKKKNTKRGNLLEHEKQALIKFQNLF